MSLFTQPTLAELLEPEVGGPEVARRTVALVELSGGRQRSAYPAVLAESDDGGFLRVVDLALESVAGEFALATDDGAGTCEYVELHASGAPRTMTVDWRAARASERIPSPRAA